MHEESSMNSISKSKPAFLFLLVVFAAALFLLSSCMAERKNPISVDYFVIDYPPPGALENLSSSALKIEKFSGVRSADTATMQYRKGPLKLEDYNYQRWKTPPSDMITDLVIRDIRSSGLFKAVLPYRAGEDAGYLLSGRLEEFVEMDSGASGSAVVSLSVVFSEAGKKDGRGKIIFQKGYRVETTLREQTADALAEGMSEAVRVLSGRIIDDISSAVKKPAVIQPAH